MTIGKYIMVIAAAVITIGTVAFKGIETVKVEIEETTLAPVIFYHVGDGSYQRAMPSASSCSTELLNPCTITYDDANDIGNLQEFEYSSKPSAPHEESNPGVWN